MKNIIKSKIRHLFAPYANELEFDEKDWEVFENRFFEILKQQEKKILNKVEKYLPHCTGCTDPDSEGTHQEGTQEHFREFI